MPELWEKSADGVNRKLRELWEKDHSGVNRKQKELWAKDGNGVNRKIFSAVQVGDNYVFGGHNYKVVNVDASTGQAVIVCIDKVNEYMSLMAFNMSPTNDWSNSDIRKYLNNNFYSTLSASEKEKIITYKNYFSPVSDNIWLLPLQRVFNIENNQFQWFAQHNTDAERATLFNNCASWLNTPYIGNSTMVYYVTSNGSYDYQDSYGGAQCNPAILINP